MVNVFKKPVFLEFYCVFKDVNNHSIGGVLLALLHNNMGVVIYQAFTLRTYDCFRCYSGTCFLPVFHQFGILKGREGLVNFVLVFEVTFMYHERTSFDEPFWYTNNFIRR